MNSRKKQGIKNNQPFNYKPRSNKDNKGEKNQSLHYKSNYSPPNPRRQANKKQTNELEGGQSREASRDVPWVGRRKGVRSGTKRPAAKVQGRSLWAVRSAVESRPPLRPRAAPITTFLSLSFPSGFMGLCSKGMLLAGGL